MKIKMTVPENSNMWEIQFPEAALKAEEYIYNFPELTKNRSSLSIALTNNYVSWDHYSEWFVTQHNCQKLKDDLTLEDLLNLNELYQKNHQENFDQGNQSTKKEISHNEDLITDHFKITTWNEFNLILGTTYYFNLKQKVKEIFTLCPPKFLDFIQQNNFTSQNKELFWEQKIGFYKLEEKNIRENYDGFCLLKIENNQTTAVYLDEELQNELSETEVFNFDLSQDSFLKKSIVKAIGPLNDDTSTPLTIPLSEENFNVLDYQTAEIEPLFEAGVAVGFFIGFSLNSQQVEQNQAA